MLSRLGVRQKLSILLALPLIAVVAVSVPFTADGVEDALSARSTVTVAKRARSAAALIQDLQEERLLTLTYLASSDTERAAVRTAVAAVSDRAERVLAELRSPEDNELMSSIQDIRRLDVVRQMALNRQGSPVEVDKVYHQLVMGMISALGLTKYARADAAGLTQLRTLEALLRINEDITRIGAALVIGTTNAPVASQLIVETLLMIEQDVERFRAEADANQSKLLALVVQGQTAQQINEYARQITSGGLWVSATKALTTAEGVLSLTRVLQERMARDIAGRAEDRATDAQTGAGFVVGFAILLVCCVATLSALVTRSIAGPLRRLTAAAASVADLAQAELVRVADSETERAQPPRLAAVRVATDDEIGELAAAFNRVQATAALLMEQQFMARNNVAIMFSNIAKRTRSLVARQLTFIDELEHHEWDEQAMAKLRRLDYLTTRLHRSTDSLLVVSGIREGSDIASPTPLIDIVRSVIGEIEGAQTVELGMVCDVTITPDLAPDLRLILAEVVENATSFSPPDSPIRIGAMLDRDVQIIVADHGIGMTAEQLAEENRRLVDRERLDVVPTSTFGLFVVGRLARRHGLPVTLAHSSGQGVTVEVRIPEGSFASSAFRQSTSGSTAVASANEQPMLQLPRYPDPGIVQQLPKVPALPYVEGSFPWFEDADGGERRPEDYAIQDREYNVAAVDPLGPTARTGTLSQFPTTATEQDIPFVPDGPTSPMAYSQAASQMVSTGQDTSFERVAPGDTPPAVARSTRAGLVRRVPGAHLSESLRYGPASVSRRLEPGIRDAEAERDALQSLVDGFARAAAPEVESSQTVHPDQSESQ
ncbi:MAG: sensor histidine kinase [Micromonosporaceae bacterium]|nr:sensor histidine kinase [Micromonosporaceae bacterium]